MSSHPKTLLALALSLAAGSAAAQTVTAVPTAPDGMSTGGAGGAATLGNNGAASMPTMGMTPSMGGGFGAVTAVPSAPTPSASAANLTGAAGVPAGVAPAGVVPAGAAPSPTLPGRTPARNIPAAAVPTTAVNGAPANQTGIPASRAANEAPSLSRGSRSVAALSGAHPTIAPGVSSGKAGVPTAGAALDGAARKISEAKLSENAGGDDMSVSRALDKAFDAAIGGAALRGSVAASAQDVRGAIAQKVGIANTASPADAPSLYQDAIQTAKEALPAPAAAGIATVVRSFAARKADVSLGDLASAAFTAAAGGSTAETGRLLTAFDKWGALLGSQGHPLISNAAELKSGVTDLLKSSQEGGSRSAPHVWFAKKDGSYTAVLPGAGVAPVPALAAAFAIAPSALAPETALSDAYRAFSSDPRASTGAGLVYRARRSLGETVPSAFLSASRFWLRAALESLWQRIVYFFKGAPAYQLSQKSGQDALKRDAALAETARGEAAAARRLLSEVRLTVAGTRAAFAALARSADAYKALTGESDASIAVETLRRSFESAAAWKKLRASDELPPGLAELVSGPGAVDHWAQRLEDAASRSVDGRFWAARGAAEFVNLGAENGPAVAAAAAAKAASGTPLTMVALDDRFWARGQGANGEARLSAELRATASGGAVELFVERGDAALSRRLEDIGLTVFTSGAGLRAVVGPEDFAYGADELGALASRALAAALGRDEAGAGSALRDLAAETKRDPASAAQLAALLDGREAFARAPVIGLVGDYEALAPTTVSVDGKPLLVSALRDPDTGLLAYARAARPNGAPLGAAEIRALLRAK